MGLGTKLGYAGWGVHTHGVGQRQGQEEEEEEELGGRRRGESLDAWRSTSSQRIRGVSLPLTWQCPCPYSSRSASV